MHVAFELGRSSKNKWRGADIKNSKKGSGVFHEEIYFWKESQYRNWLLCKFNFNFALYAIEIHYNVGIIIIIIITSIQDYLAACRGKELKAERGGVDIFPYFRQSLIYSVQGSKPHEGHGADCAIHNIFLGGGVDRRQT